MLRGGGAGPGLPSPATKFFFIKIKKNTKNVLKQKDMQKYFVKYLQGGPLKTFFRIFSHFKNIYIYTCQINCVIAISTTAGWRGKGLSGRVR